MLRACVFHYDKNWDKCIPLAEFSYNNSYQASLKMAPFEALYGRRCRTPLSWCQARERKIYGPDLVIEAEEKVRVIQKNLEIAQSRQKSYFDKRRKPIQFELGDFCLSLSLPHQRSAEIWSNRKTRTPLHWFLWNHWEMRTRGLSSQTSNQTFSYSWCIPCLTTQEVCPSSDRNRSYDERPIKILDQKERKTRRREVRMYKIQWSHHTEEQATWETEDYLHKNFPGFLSDPKGTTLPHDL